MVIERLKSLIDTSKIRRRRPCRSQWGLESGLSIVGAKASLAVGGPLKEAREMIEVSSLGPVW
jgi:hypothetical protein